MSTPQEENLYRRACAFDRANGSLSVSRLQRGLRLGHDSAARLIERMEREGVVGARPIMCWGETRLPPDAPGLIIYP